MRIVLSLAATLLFVIPATAGTKAPYYGPKQGIMGEGYKHSAQKDGSWRIVTEYHSSDPMLALDVALYRAAEMAKEGGQRYVQILGGYGSSNYGVANGFVYARASDSPSAPPSCRDKRCYTADVAQVLDALSGPSGNEPGIAKPSIQLDEKGRQVMMLGMGIGAIAWKDK
jgi:hypothetical protein